MKKTILKSYASLLLGIVFYHFTAFGADFVPEIGYWVIVAVLLVVFAELMSLLWTNTSVICKKVKGWYYPVLLTVLYLAAPVYVIVKQCL